MKPEYINATQNQPDFFEIIYKVSNEEKRHRVDVEDLEPSEHKEYRRLDLSEFAEWLWEVRSLAQKLISN